MSQAPPIGVQVRCLPVPSSHSCALHTVCCSGSQDVPSSCRAPGGDVPPAGPNSHDASLCLTGPVQIDPNHNFCGSALSEGLVGLVLARFPICGFGIIHFALCR